MTPAWHPFAGGRRLQHLPGTAPLSLGIRHASDTRTVRRVSSRRSLSDIASQIIHPKKDGFKDEDLQTLARLCGKSKFYLPTEYALESLILPTCFRATAQYLVQHGTETRAIFRTAGSPKVVNAIYDHYCPARGEADMIDTTVSSPNLPAYFNASVHDVAGAFKKFLTGLPGGVLGSLALFDALVAIHSQVYADPEVNRTKQSRLRARLIALAIGTSRSRYRRELICAVFGLLSLIGRAAELAPRENGQGHPLPTSDLMGYRELGDIFGPLLVGDLLDSYTMQLASPADGLILLPISPPTPRSRRARSEQKSKPADTDTDHPRPPLIKVDKMEVASSVAEMVITNWREVVRHMRSIQVLNTSKELRAAGQQTQQQQLRPSASETFAPRQSPEHPPTAESQEKTTQVRTHPGQELHGGDDA
ncbi:hypothetical protein GE09DRAFT_1172281 [Coniochaeta sp. 2T2.1]|nr:hypothetical protein GE09DRAFT_1172281 [Coniochaeta sp. 2T2.1]